MPGTLIVVDGRTANARFLKSNLQLDLIQIQEENQQLQAQLITSEKQKKEIKQRFLELETQQKLFLSTSKEQKEIIDRLLSRLENRNILLDELRDLFKEQLKTNKDNFYNIEKRLKSIENKLPIQIQDNNNLRSKNDEVTILRSELEAKNHEIRSLESELEKEDDILTRLKQKIEALNERLDLKKSSLTQEEKVSLTEETITRAWKGLINKIELQTNNNGEYLIKQGNNNQNFLYLNPESVLNSESIDMWQKVRLFTIKKQASRTPYQIEHITPAIVIRSSSGWLLQESGEIYFV